MNYKVLFFYNYMVLLALHRAAEFCGLNIADNNLCTDHKEVTQNTSVCMCHAIKMLAAENRHKLVELTTVTV